MTASSPASAPRRLPSLAVPPRWRLPLGILLVAVTIIGTVLNSVITITAGGGYPIDYSIFGEPGAHVLLLQWNSVFVDKRIQAGPIELAYWGIPFLLGVHGRMAWIVVGIVANSLSVIAVAAVTERLLRAITRTWSITLALAIAATAALGGQLASLFAVGHPAEMAIPLLWLISAALARRGNPMAAAAVLASTTGWELWGILAVPVLLLAPRIDLRTVWRSAVGGIVVVAVLFVPFLLLGPFNMFEFSWPVNTESLAHLLFPNSPTFAWPLRIAQGILALGLGTTTALLVKRGIDAIWLVPLVTCVVRLLADPVLAHYYSIPPFVLLLVGTAFSVAQRSWIVFVTCLIALNLLSDLPLSPVTLGISLLLLAATTAVLLRRARQTVLAPPSGRL